MDEEACTRSVTFQNTHTHTHTQTHTHTHITLQVEPCLQGFDANVLRITTGKFDTFIDWLATRLTDVS